jgi:HPt (histidine-containing phosphotransfer) domain-containing protein
MKTDSKISSPVVDLDGALLRLGGDEQLFGDMVAYMLEDAPPLVRDLRSAADSNDAPTIRMRAHALKGLVAGCGGVRAAEAAQLLENAGDSGQLDRVNELIQTLDDELERLTEVLAPYRR